MASLRWHQGPLARRIHNGRLLRRDHDPDVGSSRCDQRLIHRSRVVGSVCSEPRDGAFNLLQYRDANGRIGYDSVCESRSDDVAVPVNGQMQLAPAAAPARGPVFVCLPSTVAKYLQAPRVDDEMERVFMTPGRVAGPPHCLDVVRASCGRVSGGQGPSSQSERRRSLRSVATAGGRPFSRLVRLRSPS